MATIILTNGPIFNDDPPDEGVGVTTVALAIFTGIASSPPTESGWLDRIIDKLGKAGIAVDLCFRHSPLLRFIVRKPSGGSSGKYGHRVPAFSRGVHQPGIQNEALPCVVNSPNAKYRQSICDGLAHGQRNGGLNNAKTTPDNALAAFRGERNDHRRAQCWFGHHLLGR